MLNSDQDIRHKLLTARLPAMPHILIKLIDSCQDEEVGLDDLADLIAKDPAVTMRVLGAANTSASPRLTHKPGLRQALLALGMETTKSLLTSEAVSQVFNGFTHSDHHDLRGFWRHSYSAALAARKIAVMTDYPHLEEAYLAGMLHDVGRLALLSIAPAEYTMLLAHVDDGGLCQAEQQTFGITHAESGAHLIERFHLDSFLADSVLYHHEPLAQVAAAHPLIRITILADLIASHGAAEPALEAAKILFKLDAAALKSICAETEERVKEAAKFFSIDLTGTEQSMAVPYPSKRANDEGNARDQLVYAVQQVILAGEARRVFARPESQTELIAAVAKSAALQFGFDNVLFLLQDDSGQNLRGVALEPSRQSFSEFSIPLAAGGAIAAAAGQRQVVFLDAETESHSLAEKQLFRLVNATHLVCLPLFTGQNTLGVLIGTATPYQISQLRTRANSLKTFTGQAAAAMHAIHTKSTDSGRFAEEYRQELRRIVHEASNPLSIIRNYLAVLDAKVKRKEPVQTEVSILSQEIDHVVQILRGVSEIKIESTRQLLSINDVVNEVVKFLQVTGFVPPAIRIEMQLQQEVVKVKADSKVLKQILVNLIKNAVEAIQGEGEIVIATPSYMNRDGRLYCVLTVTDNGPGIAPQILAKLFSPVRSVKSGDHAGLGLSIVHGLVQDMGGNITCRSSSTGTTFEMLLLVDSGTADGLDNENSLNLKSIGGIHGRD